MYARLDVARAGLVIRYARDTYELQAATAAKAPGYQTTMRSRKTLVNYDIYIHTQVSRHGPLARHFAPAAKRSSAS